MSQGTLEISGQKLGVRFYVPGEPRGKARHRSRVVNTKSGKQFVQSYTPKETVEYENLVRLEAQAAMAGRAPTDYPVLVEMFINLSVPASWSAKKRALALSGQIIPTKKPDLDNVLKSICDGCNGIVFRDDSQVANVIISRRFAETPCVLVCVREIEG